MLWPTTSIDLLPRRRMLSRRCVRSFVPGRKESHWMWFIFPQLRALGRSGMAQRYGIEDAAEASAYWEHPLLGPRLRRCAELVLAHRDRSVHEIFGSPDDLKLCSCMTLFETIATAEPVFGQVLAAFYDGQRDPATLAELRGSE